MDKEIGPNSCRICLGQGAKFLFLATTTPSNSDTNNDPTFSQFDRLAEKMRFVGMINVSILKLFWQNPTILLIFRYARLILSQKSFATAVSFN